MQVKRLTLVARKKAAVAELINCSATKKFTQKQYEQTAKKYLIHTKQLKVAMSNFLNFGMVDLRYRSAKANAPKRDDAVANAYSNAKNLAVLTSTFAMKPLDELRVLLHEYINSSEMIQLVSKLRQEDEAKKAIKPNRNKRRSRIRHR